MHPEDAYPKTIEGKLEALDFDTMLNSPISFQCFFDYIEDHATHYKPFMQVFMLTKMYQEQVDMIMGYNGPKSMD